MFDFLEGIDRTIILAVNGANHPILDEFFWWVSNKLVWSPLYFLILYLVWKTYKWKGMFIFLGLALAMIAVSDAGTTYLFKETVQRYRPSHHLLLENQLHFYVKANGEVQKGGQFGFFSSHAANFVALALFAGLSLRRSYPKFLWVLLAIAALVCYSRMYLAMHYLSDVLCGAVWGAFWGYVAYRVFIKVKRSVLTE